MSPALRRTLYVLAAIGSAVVAAFVISAAAVHALVPDLLRALGDDVQLEYFQLRERSSPPRGIARGKGLALIAESDTGSLHASDIRVAGRLDIAPTQFDDVKLVQRWLPRDIGLAFDDGTASFSGHLQVSDAAAGDVTGALALFARDLRGHWDDATFEGDFLVKTALRVADLDEGVFDLEEMSASASDVRWRAAAGALWVDDWWLRVDMPSGRASLATPRSLSGRVHYTLASSDPLLNGVVDEDEVAGWVHDLLEQPDVEGSAFVAIQEDAYAVRDLVVHAGRRSELRLEMERRGSWRRGVLWAQLGLLSTGVEFDGPRRRVRLLKAVSWFERKEAEL